MGQQLVVTLYQGCTVPSLRFFFIVSPGQTFGVTSSKDCKKIQKKTVGTKQTGTDRHVTGKMFHLSLSGEN
jgi:hypothetical protein